MSGSVRPAPSAWRRAASLVLAAGWPRTRAGAADFRLLLLQRAASQRFLPGAHVFPGGVLDAADYSADWLGLFAPHHGPPRFGLGPARPAAPAPAPPVVTPPAEAAALPEDVAARICAVREAFEEAGVLLLRPRGGGAGAGAGPGCARAAPPDLAAWRARVRGDARRFLQLCARLDCTPDIWALREWSAWLTPALVGARRFDAVFFLCCLRQPPPVQPDGSEVVDYQWLSPPEATRSFASEKIWLAPPQFYEVRRLDNFTSLSALHKFSLDHALEGTERWLPITYLTADGRIQLLPGDELYIHDSSFLEKILSTEKTTDEVMKEGQKFHRIVIYSNYTYGIYVTVESKDKQMYPKTFVGSKSHL
uniref:nucleoside diphosphate-linked moiety X motif 19 n=1 Tax=Jaculus jaculus TaxID=51337 RepID=UPI001E1B5E66|nr:nucleoside diphosphate-linked moiety X motif 19 [Jaculus jaculus]